MFKHVLIAEDLDSVNLAVQQMFERLGVSKIENTQYCDQAFLKCKKAELDGDPIELLICDLSFKQDFRQEKIENGEELIWKLKNDFPSIKIIVHFVEDHPNTVKRLWESGKIDAYICKDRNGMQNLKDAILKVYKNEKYLPKSLKDTLKQDNIVQIAQYEVRILKLLSEGFTQEEIHLKFKENGIYPHSKSSIEKRLKELKEDFGARTNPQLISMAKDLKII